MSKRAGIFLVCIIIAAAAVGETVSSQNDAEATYVKYVNAWRAKDLPSLEKLIASDYMTLNGDNMIANKKAELAEAKNDPAFDQMEVTEIHSLVRGDTAVVTGIIAVTGKNSAGKQFSAKTRFLATLLKRDGHWQLIADQSAPSK